MRTRRNTVVSILGALALSAATPGALAASDPAAAHAAAAKPKPRHVEAKRWLTAGAPNAIAVVGGEVSVTMGTVDKVSRFTATGRLLGTFGIGFSFPYGIDGDPAGNLHVTQYSGSDSTRQIHVLRPDGREVRTYGVPAGASGSFSPWGLALLPDGTTWVANVTGNDIQRVMPDGSWGGRLGGPGAGAGQFDQPRDVAVDSGDLYVVDSQNDRVQRFDAGTGVFKNAWGESGYGPGQFSNPLAVDVTGDGRVLVLDHRAEDAVLSEFRPDGRFLGRTTLPISEVRSMAVDDAGAAYVTGLIDYPRGGWGVLKVVRNAPSTAKVTGSLLNADRRRRKATTRIGCINGRTGCAGRIKVSAGRKSLGTGAYRIPAGATKSVAVRLTKQARAALKRRAEVTVTVKLAASRGGGSSKRMTMTR